MPFFQECEYKKIWSNMVILLPTLPLDQGEGGQREAGSGLGYFVQILDTFLKTNPNFAIQGTYGEHGYFGQIPYIFGQVPGSYD